MERKDYYQILGLDRNADADAVRRAYRQKAKKLHPDVNPGDPEAGRRFKEVKEAYEVLSDPKKRARYDSLGADWERVAGAGAGPRQVRWEEAGDAAQFSDFFKAIFGDFFSPGRRVHFSGMGPDAFGARGFGGRDPFGAVRGAPPGPDAGAPEVPLDLTVSEACAGGRKQLALDAAEPCGACGGAGCGACGGTGRGTRRRELTVTIPAGVRDGSRIRLAGQAGGGADLYLRVRLTGDERFTLSGDDLECEVEAPLTDFVLGGEIDVPTPQGPQRLKIPAGTQNGRRFRIRGQGFPKGKGAGRGDLYVRVRALLPERWTDEERRAAERRREKRGPA